MTHTDRLEMYSPNNCNLRKLPDTNKPETRCISTNTSDKLENESNETIYMNSLNIKDNIDLVNNKTSCEDGARLNNLNVTVHNYDDYVSTVYPEEPKQRNNSTNSGKLDISVKEFLSFTRRTKREI